MGTGNTGTPVLVQGDLGKLGVQLHHLQVKGGDGSMV